MLWALVGEHWVTLSVALVLGTAWFFAWAGTWIIKENESGLLIRKFGRSLPPGRLIALKGEAGYQADLLSPGWHFGLWQWQYRVQKVPMVTVPPAGDRAGGGLRRRPHSLRAHPGARGGQR